MAVRRDDLADPATGHVPDLHVVVAVDPDDVGGAVAVEIADPGDAPLGTHRADIVEAGHVRPVHRPDRHLTRGGNPQRIRPAVAVEVADRGDIPLAAHLAAGDAEGSQRGSVHRPNREVAGIALPQNIGIAVWLKSPAPATCHSAPMPPAGVAAPSSWLPFICQIATWPEPLAHNISVSPSWLKSPVPIGVHSAPIWASETARGANPAAPASATVAFPPATESSPPCPLFAKSPVPMNCPEAVATTGLPELRRSGASAGSIGSGGSPKKTCTPFTIMTPSSELRPLTP